MPKNILTRGHSRALTSQHKIAIAGVGVLGAAALAFSAVPSSAESITTGAPAVAAQVAAQPAKDVKGTLTGQLATESVKLDTFAAKQKAAVDAAAKKQAEAAAKQKAAAEAAAKKAAQERAAKEAASRSAQRPQMQLVAAKTYANNLDGWIRQALDIMKSKGIPGSYNGLHKNIMRESSGNPMAINNWDINAINGIPSKGLLQVIPPTFNAYHVAGTSWNIYDPVANITAAANYAADKYGSIDNVNSAY
ncbi:transglycosylase SLT domain-containing protein [Streptomyces sp. Ag109_G2-15]|uniref:transglycosylase SLT domain-containing protein n=1 Tax=Streptomyces sp. Ag109_G2-15 TaxID=1938850 RepID=UPI000BC84B5C|nr:transglycosylase SLT domain-containing protein [Streptomyces sp. Ag109_G2-15]SOD87573.1 Transglycosylase SLT domain-containing protein [Streptomyces sp. Ag109_G2-15]